MKTQSRRASFVEACANTFSAMLLSLTISWWLLTWLEGHDPFLLAAVTTAVMTVVSVIRNYLWRRFFERKKNVNTN